MALLIRAPQLFAGRRRADKKGGGDEGRFTRECGMLSCPSTHSASTSFLSVSQRPVTSAAFDSPPQPGDYRDVSRGTGRDLSPAVDDRILAALAANAWFVFSLSGGKDRTSASYAAMAMLDAHHHPRDRRIAIHADLGRAEWKSTPATVEAIAARLGLPLIVVRRDAGDMVARWEQRFRNACRRYEDLETYWLIGPWSQANKRFCTSELKVQVIGRELARRFRGQNRRVGHRFAPLGKHRAPSDAGIAGR